MNAYREQVELAVRATQFSSPDRYAWFGHPRSAPAGLDAATARPWLTAALQSDLYFSFYTLGSPSPLRPGGGVPPTSDAAFAAELAQANQGHGYWESGSTVESVAGSAIEVSRGGLHAWAAAEDCRADEGAVVPGARVAVRRGKGLSAYSPGAYTAVGDVDLAAGASEPIVRLYWHVTPEGAVQLMRAATTLLNRAGVPFRLKVADHPEAFERRDASVLYLRAADFDAAARLLKTTYTRLAVHLLPGTPALTKEVAPGVGFAEDPGNAESFGEARCRLLAEALVDAARQGRRSVDGRMNVIASRFEAAGLRLDAPYLNPGAVDAYPAFPIARPRRSKASTAVVEPASPQAIEEAALALAHEVAALAHRHGGACTWTGIAPGVDGRLAYVALGPDLYLGSSGIALFLAAAAARAGDPALREVALGAVEHALRRAESIAPGRRLGLYDGWTGVALAAVRVGATLDRPEIVERGAALAKGVLEEDARKTGFDLIGGKAGAILGLLCLSDVLQEAPLRRHAVFLGDALIASAKRRDDALSWQSPGQPGEAPLTGLSHGASGAILALTELYAATREPRFAESVRLALAFEERWFDPQAGNWPDFRDVGRRAVRTAPRRFATAWCHGAPGIALARLRVHEVLGNAAPTAAASAALATTRRSVQAMLSTPGASLGLCHGLAGNADVLLHGARTLDTETGCAAAAQAAGAELVAQAGRGSLTRRLDSPSLMVGAAGVGYFLLRLTDPQLPSVLSIGPLSSVTRPGDL